MIRERFLSILADFFLVVSYEINVVHDLNVVNFDLF